MYSVVLSPTYQVPVLYFYLPNSPQNGIADIDFIHRFLVPKTTVTQLQNVGVMGGISMTVGSENSS